MFISNAMYKSNHIVSLNISNDINMIQTHYLVYSLYYYHQANKIADKAMQPRENVHLISGHNNTATSKE